MHAALFSLVVLLAVVAAAAGDAGVRAPGDLIVFSSTRGPNVGNLEIYSVRLDGTARRDLSRSQGLDAFPAVSPGGRLIAYVSVRPKADREVWALEVMRPDGSRKRTLSPDSLRVEPDSRPTWSPDGTSIAFAAETGGAGWPSVYTVRLDGSALKTVASDAAHPTWEPNGRRIAFVKVASPGESRIGVVGEDGTGEALLTNGHLDHLPAWAPSGGTLAFARVQPLSLNMSLYLVSAEGGPARPVVAPGIDTIQTVAWLSPRRIVFAGGNVWSVATSGGEPARLAIGGAPAPSPDRRRIAYIAGRSLRVMSATGQNRRIVLPLSHEFVYGEPVWAGRGLLFASGRDETDFDLWTARSSGGHLRQLTHTAVNELYPQWSPGRRRIAFVRVKDWTERNPSIWVADANARHARRLGRGTHPSWSPNGRELAFSRGSAVYTVRRQGGRPQRLVSGSAPSWSPRGTQIALVRGHEALILDLRSRSVRTLIDLDPLLECQDIGAVLETPEWSPDGRRLLVVGMCDRGRTNRVIGVLVSADGADIEEWRGPVGTSQPAWSPGGGRIAISQQTSLVSSKLDGSEQRIVTWGSAGVRDPDW